MPWGGSFDKISKGTPPLKKKATPKNFYFFLHGLFQNSRLTGSGHAGQNLHAIVKRPLYLRGDNF
ncbi:hypothetical protein CFR76_12005 [Komagataeibacter swingsii]|uniref:Uncharacterized protein n=1 Tax=Komagataeibacter swingsii TaxID=215220 RepID=A0A2V4RGC3_9PROT|nr:hypothetical protein CFR76_12005 [Komagataeibacter swingsii]